MRRLWGRAPDRGFYLKVVLSAVAVALLLVAANVGEALALLPTLDPSYVWLALALITADRILMAFKWKILLDAVQVRVPLAEAIRTYYLGNFVGSVLPATTIGIDVTRAWRLARLDHDLAKITASIIVERVLGFIVLGLLSLLGLSLLIVYAGVQLPNALWLNVLAIVLLGAAVALSFSPRVRALVERKAARFIGRSRFANRLRQVYDAYQQFNNARGSLAVFLALTCVEMALPVATTYWLALSLHIDVAPASIALVMPTYYFLSRIPLAVNIIGLEEGLFVLLLSIVQVAPAQALALALLQRIVLVLAVSPGLLVYLRDPHHSKPRVDAV
ncbi:MAG: lysylphosphatidylglycerol synthase transmembrane domain-containing protein [Chloroflexota bacterium]